MTKVEVGGSMNSWAAAIRQANKAGLAPDFWESEEVKLRGLKTLQGLGLPHVQAATSTLSAFLAEPDEVLDKLGDHGKYHVSLISDCWRDRDRKGELSFVEVIGFIERKVVPERIKDYKVILKPWYPNAYGGNIVIGDEGQIRVELAEGNHLELVEGRVTPCAFAQSDPFTRMVRYYEYGYGENGQWIKQELTNDELKQAIFRTLGCIPRDNEVGSYDKAFHPGYYEFILTRKVPEGVLMPMFIDYRGSSVYQMTK